MKKIIAFMLIIVSLFCFVACAKNTGLDIETFTEEMNDVDSYLNLKENKDKYKYSSDDVEYTVTCNSKGYITNILIECKNIPITDVNSRYNFTDVLSKDYTSWTKSEYRVAALYTRYLTILSIFNENVSSLTQWEIIGMITMELKRTYNNWELYAYIESEQTNIIANYKG